MIQSGRMLDISEVANNELIRRLSEQRATLSAQMALEGRTLLPQHPRMKELVAQLADLDKQIRLAAEKTVRGLENDAKIAGSRVESVQAALDEQKKTSSLGNEKEVQLRALERDAKAARDQLEAYLAKYREASARDDDKAVPPDARVIARALVPSTPSFPKKIPIISIATLGTLVLAMAGVMAKELAFPASGRQPRAPDPARGRKFRMRRKVEPSAGVADHLPDALVSEGAAASLPAIAAAEEHRQGDVTIAPAEVGAFEMAEPETPAAEPVDLQVSKTTEIAGIAAHLLSLKPQARGIIVLLSRASDADPAPSLALPLGRDLAESCRTVLVDLDRHANNLSRETGLSEAQGVSDLMANEISFADAIHRDPLSALHIVPAGVSAPQPDDAAGGRDLTVVLQALAHTYDAVLVDTRRVEEASTMRTLIAAVDATLVVRGEADEAAMAATLERFAAEKPTLLLAVEPAANDDPLPPADVAA
jgi:succinoglycan biosynthesis transport protein ExoP